MTSIPTETHNLNFKAYFDIPHLPLHGALEEALMMLEAVGLDPDRYTINTGFSSRRDKRPKERVYTRVEVLNEILQDDATTFFIHPIRDGEEQVIHISPPFPRRPFQGYIVSSTSGLGLEEFRGLVKKVSRLGGFAFAGVDDSRYFGWQRCNKVDEYEQHYGSTQGFRITINEDLPPEIAQKLDTSKNPGSMLSVNKLTVFAAADMWLGPAFWKYSPCTKDEVLKEPWVEVEDTEHYLYLKAYPQPFTRPDGEQGRIQRRLWNVLFHQDCEWPPGSGGISDVPVGGPPELMP